MPFQSATTQDIPSQFRLGFDNTLHHVVQQDDEKFAGMSMVASDWKDNTYTATDFAKQDWSTNNARFGTTSPTEVTFGNRLGAKTKIEKELIIDKWDESLLSELGSLTHPMTEALTFGMRRKRDDIFIAALTADSVGGAFPYTTAYSFPSANIIAVGDVPLGINAGGTTALGMTPGKILTALRKAKEGHVSPSEEWFLALGPKQEQDLIEYSQVYKNDPWAQIIGVWLSNPNAKLMGVTPIVSNSLALSGSNVRTCVLFSKRAMVTAPYEGKQFMTAESTKKYALQIAHYGLWGAFRLRDELVYQILCDEDTAPSGTLATVY